MARSLPLSGPSPAEAKTRRGPVPRDGTSEQGPTDDVTGTFLRESSRASRRTATRRRTSGRYPRFRRTSSSVETEVVAEGEDPYGPRGLLQCNCGRRRYAKPIGTGRTGPGHGNRDLTGAVGARTSPGRPCRDPRALGDVGHFRGTETCVSPPRRLKP